jgi:hypothetical protein
VRELYRLAMSDDAQSDVTTCSFLEELGKVLGVGD